MFSFYIKTNKISHNLVEIRENSKFQEYQEKGNCQIQTHNLYETRTAVLGYFQGKDVEHTYRDDLARRFSFHLNPNAFGKIEMPIQVIKHDTTTTDGFKIKMCAVLIGRSQVRRATNYLEDKPFPDVNIIYHRTKKSDPKSYDNLIRQHALLVSKSRAIKLENMTQAHHYDLRKAWREDKCIRSKIVDMPKGKTTNGVVYVQYIIDYKEAVVPWVKEQLPKLRCSTDFTKPPQIVTPIGNDSMSAITRDTIMPVAKNPTSGVMDFTETFQNADLSVFQISIPKEFKQCCSTPEKASILEIL
jgi:hypothetical protein